MSDKPVFQVKVFGIQASLDRISIDSGDAVWSFDISNSENDSPVHFGLFANKAAYSARVGMFPKEQRLCALTESPINDCYRDIDQLANQFPLIYTHQNTLLERGQPFRQLFFGTNWLGIRTPEDSAIAADRSTRKTKLVSFMGSINHPKTDAYKFRSDVANMLQGHAVVDCYGKGIKEVDTKAEALSDYRFSVAMENAASDLYFSEKLIDCLLTDTIPIYFGCSGITSLFNPKGLLPFRTTEELAELISTLSEDLYDAMLPFAIENKRRAIECNWHNHLGLFTRMLSPSPLDVLTDRPSPVRLKNSVATSPLKRLLQKGLAFWGQ